MTNKEKLTRLIIETIHGLQFEEAAEKELQVRGCLVFYKNSVIEAHSVSESILRVLYDDNRSFNISSCKILGLPITIGRVMQALEGFEKLRLEKQRSKNITWLVINNDIWWKLTKENGQECTLEDQSEETINKLLELFN